MLLKNTTFLYVEDDPRSQEVMRLLMTKAMQVKHLDIFADSDDFVARLQNLAQPPDVILLDINIKPHDGFAMLELIRANDTFKNAKIIALTASVMNEEVQEMRQRGFDGAIAKPLSFSTFPELIKRVAAGETVWHIA